MVNYLKKSCYLLLLIACAFSCSRQECFTPPAPFYVRIMDRSNKDLLNTTYQQKDVRLYYLRDGNKVDVEFKFSRTQEDIPYLDMGSISWFSADPAKSKTFYLQLSPTDTDTLYVDVERVSRKRCGGYQEKQVLCNGKPCEINQSTLPPMYVLRK